MSKYKKLALSASGELIYRTTGRLVRAKALTIKGNRVYKDGRLWGYLGQQTKTQKRLSDALDQRRIKRRERALKKAGIKPSTKSKVVKVTETPDKTGKKSIVDFNDPIIDEIIDEYENIEAVSLSDDDYTRQYETEDFDQYEIELSEEEAKRIEEELASEKPTSPRPLSEESLKMITDITKWMRFVESDEPILPEYKKLKQEESNFARSVDARVKAGEITKTYGDVLKAAWKQSQTDEERQTVWDILKADDPEEGFEYDPEIQTISNVRVVIE